MNTLFKSLLLLTAVIGLSVTTSAKADFRDYNDKAWNQGYRASRSVARSRRVYRSPASVIVRTERAPSAIAQAPTTDRRFSYEPSQQVESGTPCPDSVTTVPAPATAQRPAESGRRFSYEPAIELSREPAVRTFSRPMTRELQKPAYLLPKTDPRKYRTGR
jgi:hypothetical protein